MKRVLLSLLLLSLSACFPAPLTLVPVDTAVALTLAAEPKTDTPLPSATFTLEPTNPVNATTQLTEGSLEAPGSECIPTGTERSRGLVTRVLDGETIEVAISNQAYLVRYIGIDAPGIVQPIQWKGPEAVNTNSTLVSGQYVTLVKDVSEVDADGYLLRYVIAGSVFVNREMVRRGLAKVRIVPPDTACEATFLIAQAEAQLSVLGVWQPTPTSTSTITPTSTNTLTPTDTLEPVCSCKIRYKCTDFRSLSDAQECYDYCKEVTGKEVLEDKNGNGLVCEGGVG
jgi:endonuclease YncB( thermonuclease family)